MLPGFNTDLKYRGETYHIQTEDLGTANPVVVTLLYHKGAIVSSKRTSYRDLAERPGFERDLAGLMKNQHKEVMRALLAGTYDRDGGIPTAVSTPAPEPAPTERSTAPAPSSSEGGPGPAAPSLDEAIRHYLEDLAP